MIQENIFRWLTIGLLVCGMGIGFYFRLRSAREGGAYEESGNWLIIVLRLIGLVVIWPLLAYVINPAWVVWAQWDVPDGLRLTAAAVAALMVPCIYWLFVAIGTNISPSHTLREGHQLITSGPYHWIRHPLYTFGFTFFLALSLLTALWWLLIGLFVPMMILMWRTPQEERNLIAEFGDDYVAYMERTGRYFPRRRKS